MGVFCHANIDFMVTLTKHMAKVDRSHCGRQTTEADGIVATWDYDEPGVNKGGPDYGISFPFRLIGWEEAPEPLEDAVMHHGYEIPLMSAAGGVA